jgi:hypothetical protein
MHAFWRGTWTRAALALLFWLVSLAFTIATSGFSDDHFGRISPARQIARYGELPFRDYFDPGYVMTELTAAGLQRWLGDNLLGEMLLNSTFIATGATLVLALAHRVTASYPIAVGAALLALFSLPRPYDFDKFLFYPLGILLCWRYAERSTIANLVMIAIGVVIAGTFRYDNGLFIAAAALVALAAVHGSILPVLMRRTAIFAGAGLIAGAPYLLFLQVNGGLGNAIDQMVAYARREGERTRLTEVPIPSPAAFRIQELPPPPPTRVFVRWAADVDDSLRADLEARYTLSGGLPRGDAADRTWSYEIGDTSKENLRAIVTDRSAVDTHLIDRASFTLVADEPAWTRFRRAVPLARMASFSWPAEEAADVLYWLFVGLPVAAAAVVLRRRTLRSADMHALVERARILSLAAMCLVVAVFILRDPIEARIGGAVPPIAVLSAWAVHRGRGKRRAVATGILLVVVNLAVVADWSWVFRRAPRDILGIRNTLRARSASPTDLSTLPKASVAGPVRYVRECTQPDDRVYATWFVPELYFFSQRAFAGGMVVTFGSHWSEPDNQRRIVERLASEKVPVVIHSTALLPTFRANYPIVDEYLRQRYMEAGTTSFSSRQDIPADTYTLLVDRSREPTGVDPVSAMPCFGGG